MIDQKTTVPKKFKTLKINKIPGNGSVPNFQSVNSPSRSLKFSELEKIAENQLHKKFPTLSLCLPKNDNDTNLTLVCFLATSSAGGSVSFYIIWNMVVSTFIKNWLNSI